MLIKMLEDDKGSTNGYEVHSYKKGQEYDVDFSLFKAFVNERKTAIEVVEKKKIEKAPENKAILPESNKSKKKEVKKKETKKKSKK